MKIKALLLVIALLASSAWLAHAQEPTSGKNAPYTVIANPGESASKEIRINWHTDVDSENSSCTYTERKDTKWKKARTVKADRELCTAFDSIYSKKPTGEDYYEDARFLRNKASLKELKAGTEYMYKISSDESGEIRYFKTAPKSGKWSVGIISDFHAYTPLPKRQQVAMEMIGTLEQKNGKDFDFILHVGDIVAWGGSYSFWKILYAEPYFHKYVWAGVNGNHDNMTRKNAQSNSFFRYTNNNPDNGYTGEEGVCYHFTYSNALFIMLNNESMRSDEGLALAKEWVKNVIKNNPAKYIVVVEHYQWFMGGDGKSSQYERWKELFDEYGVDLAISGNNHIYARTNAIYDGKETDGSLGTVYIQTPSCDNERGQEMGELIHNTDLIKLRWTEGSNTVGAMTMNADSKQLSLTLYDRNGDEKDRVKVKAKR